MSEEVASPILLELAAELTIAWLSNPNTHASIEDVPPGARAELGRTPSETTREQR